MTCLAVSEGILRLFPQLALKIRTVQMCFWLACIESIFDITNYIEITKSLMPKPVYLLTSSLTSPRKLTKLPPQTDWW